MKIIIKKNILLDHLNIVSKAISSKNIIPVLSGVKFDLYENGLFLTASDNDMIIQTFIPKEQIISIEKIGSVVVLGKYLIEYIKKLSGEEIKLELIDNIKLNIENENSEFNLNVIDFEEYPNYEFELSQNPVIINGKVLKKIINKTSFAASSQEVRPILTGININIENNKIMAIATDSYRLAKCMCKLGNIDNTFNITIPARNIIEYVKMINDNDEVQINVFSNKCIFKTPNILFQTRLLNGNYPETAHLVKDSFNFIVKANVNNLYNAIDRVSLLAIEKDKYIINFNLNNQDLIAYSNSIEIGKVEEKITVDNSNSEQLLTIAFNARYMMESLRAIESENIILHFNSDETHIILKEENNNNFIQIIPPIIN